MESEKQFRSRGGSDKADATVWEDVTQIRCPATSRVNKQNEQAKREAGRSFKPHVSPPHQPPSGPKNTAAKPLFTSSKHAKGSTHAYVSSSDTNTRLISCAPLCEEETGSCSFI